MHIFIIKDGHIFARTEGEGIAADYSLSTAETIPDYPQTEPGRGKYWELDYVDGILEWIEKDRPLTVEERLELVEEKQEEWKPGETVKIGDRRYYNGHWYVCIQAHTTQADWTPDITPALWALEG